MFDLDAHIGLHAQSLSLRARRGELIANNLANADTPGFKARDLDFRAVLAATSGSSMPLTATHATHQGMQSGAATSSVIASGRELYRIPMAPPVDGNTVDVQVEQAAFAENAIRYQATLQFISSKFRGLMTAITGQ